MMSFLVTRSGSLWSVVETTNGAIGGLFVTLEAAIGFVRSAARRKDTPLRLVVR